MCVKLSPRNLNIDPYPPHPINTYICRVTIVPRVCGSSSSFFLNVITYVYHNLVLLHFQLQNYLEGVMRFIYKIISPKKGRIIKNEYYYILGGKLEEIRQTKLMYNTLSTVPQVHLLKFCHVITLLKKHTSIHEKKSHCIILREEPKEQHLSTVSKSCSNQT